MSEEIKMKEDVNEVIKRKIVEISAPDEIKKFLNELLSLELEHIDERTSWYGWKGTYEQLIKKYARDMG